MEISSKIKRLLKEHFSVNELSVQINHPNISVGNGTLSVRSDKFFLKYYIGQIGSAMCKSESEGIRALQNSKTVHTVQIIAEVFSEEISILVLEHISTSVADAKSEAIAGEQLAYLHKIQQKLFGWQNDNFIGLLPQHNGWSEYWPDFYLEKRLKPQLNLAIENKLLSPGEIPLEIKIANFMTRYLSDVTPSLLHGDMWNGNLIYSTGGKGYFIDPAAYYGDAMVDIAMASLFGGFGEKFYKAYHHILPKGKNFEIRIQVYQLYYLLVHLNLFGFSYKSSVLNLLKLFR